MLGTISRRIWIVATTAVATLGIVAFAQAAMSNGGGVINACYNNASGSLRIVDNASSCTNAESFLSWNQSGPQGQPGAQGPTGPQGPSGMSHAYRAAGSSLLPSDAAVNLAGVHNLPAGSYVVMVSVSVFQAYDYPIVCSLRDANNAVLAIPVGYTGWPNASDGKTTTAMVTAFNLPNGGTINVRCSTQPEASNASAEIVAIKVDAIN